MRQEMGIDGGSGHAEEPSGFRHKREAPVGG